MGTAHPRSTLTQLGGRGLITTIRHVVGSPAINAPHDTFTDLGSSLTDVLEDESGSYLEAAVFEGTISGTTLTVNSLTSGTIKLGQTIQSANVGGGVGTSGPAIIAYGTGSGGAGTYTLDKTETVAVAETITALPGILVPAWANWMRWSGKMSFPAQVSGNGYCSIHLFHNGNPTNDDLHFHNRQPYSTANLSYTSLFTYSGLISAVVYRGESLNLVARQTSGATQTMYNAPGLETWMSAEFLL